MEDTELQEEIAAQSLEKKDLDKIKSLFFQRMGWSYLSQVTVTNKNAGFPCEIEELIVNQMLQKAQYGIKEWFATTSRRNNWLSKEGHFWNVDFLTGRVTLKQAEKPTSNKGKSLGEIARKQPVMTLGDIDIEVFSRLVEKRDFIADCIRPNLQPFLKGSFSEDQINTMVRQLGESIHNIMEWFSEMGKTYKWPPLPDNDWFYFADTTNKQILMAHSEQTQNI